ncbi:MAG: RES family NAD+ phosphorylase [Opitutaceae bacterium]|nr:RES family NAD+ phosphorylase [Opitutaceae bacterium]
MRLHRITAEVYGKTASQAFSGQGGLFGMGRWHSGGRPIVYSSQHESLAALETLVHLQRSECIQPFVRWEIEVPDHLIAGCGTLPDDWKTNPAATRACGDAWLAGRKSPAMRVPSVNVETEFNFLLNPIHPDFKLGWVVAGPIAFAFDLRLGMR